MQLLGEGWRDFLGRPGLYMRLRFRLRLAAWQLLGGHDEAEWYLLDRLVDPARAAIDVGANYGAYAGRLAQIAARTHCFDPLPGQGQRLANRLPRSVVVHEAAASNAEGQITLRIPLKQSGAVAGGNATVAPENRFGDQVVVRTATCRAVRIDDVVTEPVGFIKIDVEGHELAVLQGAERIIERDRPILLVESTVLNNAAEPGQTFEFVRRHGYDGIFLSHGILHDLGRFDSQKHQRIGQDGLLGEGHVFNFIFLPGA